MIWKHTHRKLFHGITFLTIGSLVGSLGVSCTGDDGGRVDQDGNETRAAALVTSRPTVAEPALLAAEVTGALPGGGAVSNGTYTYRVPIDVPPGRAGMQPAVALEYSSGAGEGMVGLGWSLSAGASAITRCGRIPAAGGYRDFVRFDATDEYCLNGSKLIVVEGAYGAVNSKYRTEIDSFARVELKALAANGEPTTFEVRYKNGRIATHTRQAALLDRKILDAAGTVTSTTQVALTWPVAKVIDRVNNKIAYNYTTTETAGIALPVLSSIEYTLCDSGTCGYPNARKRKVTFLYQPAGRARDAYLNGVRTRTSQRLWKLQTTVASGSTDVLSREYVLTYQAALTSGRDLLANVKMCDGSSPQVCLPATVFTWRDGGSVYTASDPATGISSKVVNLIPLAQRFELAPENGFGLADVDNDGNDDVLLKQWPTEVLTMSNQNQQATDLLFRGTGIGYFRSTGEAIDSAGTQVAKAGCTGRELMDPSSAQAVDIDGDGKTELLTTSNDGCPFLDRSSAGFMRVQPGNSASWAGGPRLYNLMAWGTYNGGPTRLTRSTLSTVPVISSDWGLYDLRFADMNGDGRTDLLSGQFDGVSTTWRVSVAGAQKLADPYAPGWTFQVPVVTPLPNKQAPTYRPRGAHRAADENGDGRQELVQFDFLGTQRKISFASAVTAADVGDLFYNRRVVSPSPATSSWPSDAEHPTAAAWGTPDFTDTPTIRPTASYWYHVDVNGDGLRDALYATNLGQAGVTWQLRINTGVGYLPPTDTGAAASALASYPTDTAQINGVVRNGLDNGLRIADMNGDGREDLILLDPTGTATVMGSHQYHGTTARPRIAYANGAGFDTPVFMGEQPGTAVNAYRLYRRQELFMAKVGDLDGDGKPELVDMMAVPNGITQTNKALVVWKANARTELITGVSDERGEAERITYDTLSAGSLGRGLNDLNDGSDTHVSDAKSGTRACAYPARCISRGTVVEKYENFRGAREIKTVYRYEGARVDATGRGSLGFAKTRVIDLVSGLETTSTYDQTPYYPTSGSVTHLYPKLSAPTQVETKRFRNTAVTLVGVGAGIQEFSTSEPTPKTVTQTTLNLVPGAYPVRISYTQTDRFVREETTAAGSTPLRHEFHSSVILDQYGNVQQINSNSIGYNSTRNTESSETTLNTYSNTESNWLLGLLTKHKSITFTKDDAAGTGCAPSDTTPCAQSNRVTDFVYDADGVARGLLWKIDREQAASDSVNGRRSLITLGRDAAGLVTSTARSSFDTSPATRTESVVYDESGVNVVQATNPLGHQRWFYYYAQGDGDWLYGTADQNGTASKLDVLVKRDRFGRERKREFQDAGSAASVSTSYGTGVVRRSTLETATAGFFDVHGRTVLETSNTFDNTSAVTESTYNALGLQIKTRYTGSTLSHASLSASESSARAAFNASGGSQTGAAIYDRLGRTHSATKSTNETTTFTYPAPFGTVTETGPTGRYVETFSDQNGHARSMKQRLAGTTPRDLVTTYTYDDRGLRILIKTPDGAREQYVYDNLGRSLERRQFTTSGTSYLLNRRVRYNGFDEPVSQFHGGTGTGDVRIDVTRDSLGRVSRQTLPTGEQTDCLWDTSPFGTNNGRPAQCTSTAQSSPQLDTTDSYAYDDAGGLLRWRRQFRDNTPLCAGAACPTTTVELSMTRDTQGRLATLTYPETASGDSTPEHPRTGGLTLVYGYKNGALETIRDAAQPATAPPLWTVTARHVLGRVAQATNADNVTTTWTRDMGTLRLTSETTSSIGATMTFAYYADGLLKNRSGVSSPNGGLENFGYDSLGRLTSYDRNLTPSTAANRIVASYAYDDVGNLSGVTTSASNSSDWPNVNESYNYTGVPLPIPNFLRAQTIGSSTTTFEPDSAGRVARATTGATQRDYIYSAFDLPKQIQEGNKTVRLSYDTGGLRSRKTVTTSGQLTSDVLYMGGGLYEHQKVVTGGVVSGKSIFRIRGEEGLIAEVTQPWTASALGARTTTFFYNDHQGSPTISRPVGSSAASFAGHFPFGKKMSSGTTSQSAVGYTGHVHDDDLGLIDMKGRVYDQTQRRFLTPDPVPNHMGSGGLNPYSYVSNSPLNATDPTGHCGFFGFFCGGNGGGDSGNTSPTTAVQNTVEAAAEPYVGDRNLFAEAWYGVRHAGGVIASPVIKGIFSLFDTGGDDGGGDAPAAPASDGSASGDSGAEGASGAGSESPSASPAPGGSSTPSPPAKTFPREPIAGQELLTAPHQSLERAKQPFSPGPSWDPFRLGLPAPPPGAITGFAMAGAEAQTGSSFTETLGTLDSEGHAEWMVGAGRELRIPYVGHVRAGTLKSTTGKVLVAVDVGVGPISIGGFWEPGDIGAYVSAGGEVHVGGGTVSVFGGQGISIDPKDISFDLGEEVP